MHQYNPYEMVHMLINKKPTYGRPFRFDSEIVNFNTFVNAKGELVRPSMISTCCPDCGAGLEVPVSLPEPPFGTIIAECEHCTKKTPIVDPFQNPLDSGRVNELELDPLLYDHNKPLVDDGLSVADRLGAVDGGDDFLDDDEIAALEEAASFDSPEALAAKYDTEDSDASKPKEEAPEDPEEVLEEALESVDETLGAIDKSLNAIDRHTADDVLEDADEALDSVGDTLEAIDETLDALDEDARDVAYFKKKLITPTKIPSSDDSDESDE